MARARQIGGLAFSLAGLLACSACDIVQGFQNAGDALFPPVKTYLDVPGFRLLSGAYRDLDLLTSNDVFLFARSASVTDSSLYVMRFHQPVPCRIPDVTGYWSDAGPDATRTYVAYYDGTGSATLHFSDTSCRSYDLTLDDADFPVGFTRDGLAVKSGPDLLAVNPESGTTTLLAASVQGIDVQRHLVLANGELGSFDRDWTLVRWVGSGVTRFFAAFGAVYFEDQDGIHRLVISSNPTPSALATSIAPDGCELTALPGTPGLELLAFHSPCKEQRLVVWDTNAERQFPLDLPADPRFLKLVATRGQGLGSEHPDLSREPFWALYLTDIDPDSDTGTLKVRTPAGDDLSLGDGAALERTELASAEPGGEYVGGFALLDAAGGSGRFVRWDADGSVNELATGVVRDADGPWSRLVLEVDAERADLAEVVGGELVRVARDVPLRRYAYAPSHPVPAFVGKMAWFSDFDGEAGTLSLAGPDENSRQRDDQEFEPLYTSTPVARGVYQGRHGFMNDLPGFVYLTHHDAATGTGRLEYSNAELEFSSIVSEGVADYVQPGSGLLYSVPYGEGAGIWLARAK